MTKTTRQMTFCVLLILGAGNVETIHAGDWSEPAEVRHELKRCVAYRARLNGRFLVVEAALEPGWHTFAMDNQQRAQEKLAGRKPLGMDRPTEIQLAEGLELAGPWYQTPPVDFSKPELRWFSWGFEGQARFVAKVRRLGEEPARIAIRGQACAESTCKEIDVTLSLSLAGAQSKTARADIDLKPLVQVR